MRAITLLCLALTACSDSAPVDQTARSEARAASWACQAADTRVDALERRLGMLPDPGAMQPIAARIEALEGRMAAMERAMVDRVKVPYLVIAETGIAIGPSLGEYCAWSDEVGGEVCLTSRPDAYFTGADCTGTMHLNRTYLRPSQHFASPRGTWLRPTAAVVGPTTFPSTLPGDGGACRQEPYQGTMTAMTDTGVKAQLFKPDELAIALR